MTRSPAVILYDASGNPLELGNGVPLAGNIRTSFSPDPWSTSTGEKSDVLLDSAGSLQTRGPAHTDEGSFRDHFIGSSLSTALTGTPTFTNGSTTVTGTGTAFLSEVNVQSYVKRNADGESAWTRVAEVISDTELELTDAYTGASGSSASSHSGWSTMTASGGAISVASSAVSLTNGLGNGAITCIQRLVDYGPLSVQIKASCGTRVTNQNAYIGLVDGASIVEEQAIVLFSSSLGNTQVVFRTSSSASEVTDTTVTLPNAGVTTAYHRYEITQTGQSVTLHIDGVACAKHVDNIPEPYTVMYAVVQLVNNAALGSTTTLAAHWFWVNNANRVEVTNSFAGEPVHAQIVGKDPNSLPSPVGVSSAGGLFVQPVELPTFQVSAEDVALGNNKSLLSLFLASPSTYFLKLRAIYLRNARRTAVTGTVATFDLERITGHSAGSTLTPTARDSNDTLPSEVTARTAGTMSGAVGPLWRWDWSTDEWGAGTLDTEGYQIGLQNLNPAFSKKDPALKPWVLRPGQGYHVKCATNTTAGTWDINFVFTVERD